MGDQGGQRPPAQVGIHLDAGLGPVEQPTEEHHRILVQRRLGQRLNEGELGVGVVTRVAHPIKQELCDDRFTLSRHPRRICIVLQRGDSLGQDAFQHGDLGFRGGTTGHQRDEITGLHLTRAGHLPGSRPRQGARHRIDELVDVVDHEVQGPLIQIQQRVGQIIIIDQNDISLVHTDQLRHRGGGTVDVQFDLFEAGELVVDKRVEPHRDAVGAQLTRAGDGTGLQDVERGVGAVLDGEVGGEGVDAGGLEPLAGPSGQVTARGVLEGGQQIIEGGIAPRVVGEVGAHTGEELLPADIGLQLLEHRRTLGVGDAVEVLLHRLDVVAVRGHRVGRGQLILLVGPGLLHIGKGHPRAGVLGLLGLGDHRGPGGKRLIEPQIIPPAHGDQIPEPHVCQLVQDGLRATLIAVAGGLGGEDILIADGHRTGVLHRTGIELRHEDLVIFAERVGHTEVAVVPVKPLLGLGEQTLRIQVRGQGTTAEQTQRDGELGGLTGGGLGVVGELAGPGVMHLVVAPGADSHQVGGDGVVHLGDMGVILRVLGGHLLLRIGDDLPALRGGDVEIIGGFQIRLVEAGEHPLGIGGFKLGVQVDLIVGRIHHPVQALTRAGIGDGGCDPQGVLTRCEITQGDARGLVIAVHTQGDRLIADVRPIEVDLIHRGGTQINEGVTRLTDGEADHGDGGEHILPGEIQGDRVVLHTEQM